MSVITRATSFAVALLVPLLALGGPIHQFDRDAGRIEDLETGCAVNEVAKSDGAGGLDCAADETGGGTDAITPSIVVSRTTGNAPLTVFFDATGTTTTLVGVDPWDELHYELIFGDPNSGVWSVSGKSKNVAIGALAAHLYERVGTYTPTLTVRDRSGIVVRKEAATITVSDTWTNTFCISNDTDHTGCPVSCPSSSCIDSISDFNTAMGSGRFAPDTRLLLRAGDSFTNTVVFDMVDDSGPGLIARYGTGADPIISTTGTNRSVQVSGTDWRFQDLEFDGVPGGSVATEAFSTEADTTSALRITFNRLTIKGHRASIHIINSATHSTFAAEIGVFEVTSTLPESGQSDMWMDCEWCAWMGNEVDRDNLPEHAFRGMRIFKQAIQHNKPENVTELKAAITLRGCKPGLGACSSDFGTDQSQYAIVSDNWAKDTFSNAPFTCDDGDVGEAKQAKDFIWERNYVTRDPNVGLAAKSFFLGCSDNTVRNNLLNGTNAERAAVFNTRGTQVAATISQDNLKVYNNTIWTSNEYSSGPVLCLSTTESDPNASGYAGTGHECFNNLIIDPNADSTWKVLDTGDLGWTTAGNVFYTRTPNTFAPLDCRPSTTSMPDAFQCARTLLPDTDLETAGTGEISDFAFFDALDHRRTFVSPGAVQPEEGPRVRAGHIDSLEELLGTLCASGKILEWNGTAAACITTPISGGAHNILSTTHGDTTVAALVRGDLLTGQSASPLWKRLALGTSGQCLQSDGTDAAWATVQHSDLGGVTSDLHHAQSHSAADHTGDVIPAANQLFGAFFWEQSAIPVPANPGAGISRCYSKTGSDGDLCCRNSAGVERCMSDAGAETDPVIAAIFNAHTILMAVSDDTPVALAVAASTIVGRKSTGNIVALTPTQTREIINVEDNADVTDEANVIAALDGASVPAATVATGDKVMIQDINDSSELKSVTAQSIADLASGEVNTHSSDGGGLALTAATPKVGVDLRLITAAAVDFDLAADVLSIDAAIARVAALHDQSHVLATGTALGPDHTMSGATAGDVLRALSSTTAAFDVLQHGDLGGVGSGDHHTLYTHPNHTGDVTSTGDGATVIGAGKVTESMLSLENFGSFTCAGGAGDECLLNANSVGVSEIAANAVGASEITVDAVGSSELDAPAVASELEAEIDLADLRERAHGSLTGVTAAQHHAKTVRAELAENGSDEMFIETLGTVCTDGQVVIANATGGVGCGAQPSLGSFDAGNTKHVNDAGTDTTTCGKVETPCLNLDQAIANISTAAQDNEFLIQLGPGAFWTPYRCTEDFTDKCGECADDQSACDNKFDCDADGSVLCVADQAGCSGVDNYCLSSIKFARQCTGGSKQGTQCKGECSTSTAIGCWNDEDCPGAETCTTTDHDSVCTGGGTCTPRDYISVHGAWRGVTVIKSNTKNTDVNEAAYNISHTQEWGVRNLSILDAGGSWSAFGSKGGSRQGQAANMSCQVLTDSQDPNQGHCIAFTGHNNATNEIVGGEQFSSDLDNDAIAVLLEVTTDIPFKTCTGGDRAGRSCTKENTDCSAGGGTCDLDTDFGAKSGCGSGRCVDTSQNCDENSDCTSGNCEMMLCASSDWNMSRHFPQTSGPGYRVTTPGTVCTDYPSDCGNAFNIGFFGVWSSQIGDDVNDKQCETSGGALVSYSDPFDRVKCTQDSDCTGHPDGDPGDTCEDDDDVHYMLKVDCKGQTTSGCNTVVSIDDYRFRGLTQAGSANLKPEQSLVVEDGAQILLSQVEYDSLTESVEAGGSGSSIDPGFDSAQKENRLRLVPLTEGEHSASTIEGLLWYRATGDTLNFRRAAGSAKLIDDASGIIQDLINVNTVSLATWDLLTSDSGVFKNFGLGTIAARTETDCGILSDEHCGIDIEELSNTTGTAPNADEILTYNGSAWDGVDFGLRLSVAADTAAFFEEDKAAGISIPLVLSNPGGGSLTVGEGAMLQIRHGDNGEILGEVEGLVTDVASGGDADLLLRAVDNGVAETVMRLVAKHASDEQQVLLFGAASNPSAENRRLILGDGSESVEIRLVGGSADDFRLSYLNGSTLEAEFFFDGTLNDLFVTNYNSGGNLILQVDSPGRIVFGEESGAQYEFPLDDGAAGQVLINDGASPADLRWDWPEVWTFGMFGQLGYNTLEAKLYIAPGWSADDTFCDDGCSTTAGAAGGGVPIDCTIRSVSIWASAPPDVSGETITAGISINKSTTAVATCVMTSSDGDTHQCDVTQELTKGEEVAILLQCTGSASECAGATNESVQFVCIGDS